MSLGHRIAGTGAHRVIALHGWLGDETTYDPMLPALSLSEFTYLFPAYRGYGASPAQSGSYSMAEIAADVLARADEQGWSTFSLIGHSMGGMAIQRILADAPARVHRMVAVTPVPANGVPSRHLPAGRRLCLHVQRGHARQYRGADALRAWPQLEAHRLPRQQ